MRISDWSSDVCSSDLTNPGLVWSEYLAQYYGTDASPNGNGQSGDNYAAGGARVGVDTVGGLGPIPSLATQMNNYLAANGGRADPDALYSVWGGANDVFAVVSDPAQAQAIIGGAVTAQVTIVGTLQAAGRSEEHTSEPQSLMR